MKEITEHAAALLLLTCEHY